MFILSPSLNVETASRALSDGMKAIAGGQVEIDLAPVTVVDSAAVAVLLAWQRAATARGARLLIKNVPANLQSLAKLYGVADLLHPITSPAHSH
ncbi:MAG: STAS domain-containing protein [Pseudomonadota bacterium]